MATTKKTSIGSTIADLIRTSGRPRGYNGRHRLPKPLPGVSGRPTDDTPVPSASAGAEA